STSPSRLSVAGDLVVSSGGLVNIATDGFRAGGGTLGVTGTIVNGGAISIYNDTTVSATVVSAADLTGSGSVTLWGNRFGDGSAAAELILTAGVAPTVLSRSLTLSGPSLL